MGYYHILTYGVSGTYTFSGWDASDDADLIANGMEGNATFKGEWKFTPNKQIDDDTPQDNNDKTPQDNNDKTPQTGDSSNLLLWLAIMIFSIVSLIGIIVYGKRKVF